MEKSSQSLLQQQGSGGAGAVRGGAGPGGHKGVHLQESS